MRENREGDFEKWDDKAAPSDGIILVLIVLAAGLFGAVAILAAVIAGKP